MTLWYSSISRPTIFVKDSKFEIFENYANSKINHNRLLFTATRLGGEKVCGNCGFI